MSSVTEITKMRRRVLTEVARLKWQNLLVEKIDELPEHLVLQHEQYRCCEYKEKAIYEERIKLAMGLTLDASNKHKPLHQLAEKALNFPQGPQSQVEVIDIACDKCPIDKYFITNACRNCLVHSCQQACPKGAISIVENQAYIDQTRCIEGGICMKSCPFGAIIKIHRPCEQSCAVNAITSGEDRKSVINHEECTDCGACLVSCPFGAISDRSQILKVIEYLQNYKNVVAMVAPAIVGQLGQKDDLRPVIQALKKIGFAEVVEVAEGADLVAIAETAELLRRVPKEVDFITSSCCPAFTKIIENKYPQYKDNISTYVSPMLAIANVIKEKNPNTITVFIGPCIAKKREAWGSDCVDAVLTFEEMAAILVAAGINAAEITPEGEDFSAASVLGQGFAASGGVAQALIASLPEQKRKGYKVIKADGASECCEILKRVEKGDIKANYIEGMACTGGCLNGPGTLIDNRFSKIYLRSRGDKQKLETPLDNLMVQAVLGHRPNYMHRQNQEGGEKN